MRFEIKEPAFVGGQYYPASVQLPTIVEFPDGDLESVSLTWKPLDDAAAKAQADLAAKKGLKKVPTPSAGVSQVAIPGGKPANAGAAEAAAKAEAAKADAEAKVAADAKAAEDKAKADAEEEADRRGQQGQGQRRR